MPRFGVNTDHEDELAKVYFLLIHTAACTHFYSEQYIWNILTQQWRLSDNSASLRGSLQCQRLHAGSTQEEKLLEDIPRLFSEPNQTLRPNVGALHRLKH